MGNNQQMSIPRGVSELPRGIVEFNSQGKRPPFLSSPLALIYNNHTRRGFFYKTGKTELCKAIHLTSARLNSPAALMVSGKARTVYGQTPGVLAGCYFRVGTPLFYPGDPQPKDINTPYTTLYYEKANKCK